VVVALACAAPPPPDPVVEFPEDLAPERARLWHARAEADEAGQLLAQMVEAHGGMERWERRETLIFDHDHQPVVGPEGRRHARIWTDLRGHRVLHKELGEQADASLGWNGEGAWVAPRPEVYPVTPRAWVWMPTAVAAAPLWLPQRATSWEMRRRETVDGVRHHVVVVTFETEMPAWPFRACALLIAPEQHRLAAMRCEMTWSGMLPEGERHPYQFFRFLGWVQVDGLWLAQHVHVHRWDTDEGEVAEALAEVSVSPQREAGPRSPGWFEPPAAPLDGGAAD
jgi:hypothetical protein